MALKFQGFWIFGQTKAMISTKIDTYYILVISMGSLRGSFKKKKLKEFSIKLAGWVVDDPDFH